MSNNSCVDYAINFDNQDDLKEYRDKFYMPNFQGIESIYFTGNSLGLQPKITKEYINQELEDWKNLGVEGHFHAKNPWMPYHEFLTDSMANIVGAKSSEVIVMNTLSVNIHLMFVTFYQPFGKKTKIVIENDAFPSDRYAVDSHLKYRGLNVAEHLIVWKPKEGESILDIQDLREIIANYGDEIAMIFIGGVNYYTGQAFDLKEIASIGHSCGAIVGTDLAHAAGNLALKLNESEIDFAMWCTYKYLNSGPGSVGGCFIHEKHVENKELPRFAGWWGHNKSTRFNMRYGFDPIPTAEGWQLSNPPILSLAAIRASLEIFKEAGIQSLRSKSIKLSSYLIDLLKDIDNGRIQIITPLDEFSRGCQVSIKVKNADKSLFEALTRKGVIADWREPDVIRVAPVPLYNTFEEVWRFNEILKELIL